MKNLITIKKLRELKSCIETGNWSGQWSHPHRINEKDEEQALSILNSSKYSIDMLKNIVLEGNFEDFKDWVTSTTQNDLYCLNTLYDEFTVELIAVYFAHNIAYEKLKTKLWRKGDNPDKKIFLPESYIFIFNP
ncbi:MAG TPA: hypothetical protein PK891_07390 [Bacteroidales bacterium]|nr:hypothetical protein [Bacteroidales bacterium]